MTRSTQYLNGWWDYRIADGRFIKKQIPYSDPPVGFAECRLNFDADKTGFGKRAFLVFDGITYRAEVTLNGHKLGEMLPYCEYRYEVSDILYEKDNLLSVIIRDTEIVFGAGEGWENYSGITRDVYLEYTSNSIIQNVFFHSEVNEDLSAADCTAEITVEGSIDGLEARVTLLECGGKVAFSDTIALDKNKVKLQKALEAPILWSPDTPVLYTLEVVLIDQGNICDF